ncbi:hypothetical protein T484DRAFT_1905543 [Baffinella frigidus]|nr:hypothetical protein T484DRAFT_1905543 [Cryptophyta sp. CCMP2293]
MAARVGRQQQFFWEHEKTAPKKTFIVPCREADACGDWSLNDLSNGRVDLACRVISSALFFSSGVRRDVEVAVVLGQGYGEGEGEDGGGGEVIGRGKCKELASAVTRALKSLPAGLFHVRATRTVRVCGRLAKHLRPNEHTIAFQMQTAIWATSGRVTALVRRSGQSKHQEAAAGRNRPEVDDGEVGGTDAGKEGEEEGQSVLAIPERVREAVDDKFLRVLRGWTEPNSSNVSPEEKGSDVSPEENGSNASRGEAVSGAVPTVVMQLDEEGMSLDAFFTAHPPHVTPLVVVLGDHKGLHAKDMETLERVGAVKVCLGPRTLLASQCVTTLSVCLGPRPLLASQCITILLHAIDVATLGAASATEAV